MTDYAELESEAHFQHKCPLCLRWPCECPRYSGPPFSVRDIPAGPQYAYLRELGKAYQRSQDRLQNLRDQRDALRHHITAEEARSEALFLRIRLGLNSPTFPPSGDIPPDISPDRRQ